jgi:hypothetical protein
MKSSISNLVPRFERWARLAPLALALTLGMGSALAQFNRPPDSFQSVTVTAGGNSQSDGSTGSGSAPSSAFAAVIGGGAGEPSVSSAFATTTLGVGSVSGSLGTAFAGPGSASARAEAYLGDGLTLNANTTDGVARLHFSVMLLGTSETFLDSTAVSGGVQGKAGDLNTLFVLGIDDHFSSWDTYKTLNYDGSTLLESYQTGSGPNGRTYGVFNFVAELPLGDEVPLDFYMLLTSDLNAAGISTNGAAYTDESPGLYWNGISQVTARDGTVLDYSVSSRTGVNYLLSVAPLVTPEPATWLLALAGLLPLMLWRQRAARDAAQAAEWPQNP